MKILINPTCVNSCFIGDLFGPGKLISEYNPNSSGPYRVIISNKPTSFKRLYSRNFIVDRKILATAFSISDNTSDIEIYLISDLLFGNMAKGMNDSQLYAFIINQPSPLKDIKFDIFVGYTSREYLVSYKHKIYASHNYITYSGAPIVKEYCCRVNDQEIIKTTDKQALDKLFCEEFNKLVQLVESEPIIEAKSLEEQIAELREQVAKSAQLTEQVTKTNLLETQIAELREMVSGYFPIREMEKLKLKVAGLESNNIELENENAKLKSRNVKLEDTNMKFKQLLEDSE